MLGQAFKIYKDYMLFMRQADINVVRSKDLTAVFKFKRTRAFYNAWLAYNFTNKQRDKRLNVILNKLLASRMSKQIVKWQDGVERSK